jgi:hypothetical protein
MPAVICATHGMNISPHGCRHVSERIWERQPPGHVTYVDLDGFFFTGWICDLCLSLLNGNGLQAYLEKHKGFKDYPEDKEMDPLIDLLDLQPMCSKCFQELSDANSRMMKMEPP